MLKRRTQFSIRRLLKVVPMKTKSRRIKTYPWFLNETLISLGSRIRLVTALLHYSVLCFIVFLAKGGTRSVMLISVHSSFVLHFFRCIHSLINLSTLLLLYYSSNIIANSFVRCTRVNATRMKFQTNESRMYIKSRMMLTLFMIRLKVSLHGEYDNVLFQMRILILNFSMALALGFRQ